MKQIVHIESGSVLDFAAANYKFPIEVEQGWLLFSSLLVKDNAIVGGCFEERCCDNDHVQPRIRGVVT